MQFLPGFIGQSNSVIPRGIQFGNKYADNQTGCLYPPCATIDTSLNYNDQLNLWENTFGVSLNFHWQTDTSQGYPGGNIYNFHFYTSDDWCPVPGQTERTLTVVVFGDSVIKAPIPDSGNGSSVHQFSTAMSIKIYPNPSSGSFTIEADELSGSTSTLAIFNLQGQLLMEKTMEIKNGRINTKILLDQEPGIYIAKLRSAKGEHVEKLIVD